MIALDWLQDTVVRPHLWLELTEKCNLECIHCYANSGPAQPRYGRMTSENYLTIIREFGSRGFYSIQFIGGEPTLHTDLSKFLYAARDAGFQDIELYTNALRLSDALINVLQELDVRVACSFYSHDAEMHDRVTGRLGSHSKTLNTIDRVIAAGLDLRVGIITVVGINDHSVDSTQDMLRFRGVTEIKVDSVRQIGRGNVNSVASERRLNELCGRCGDNMLSINPSGQIAACPMARDWPIASVLPSVPDADQIELALGSFRDRYRSRNYVGPPCSPEDRCTPGACAPQTGGPPYCVPKNQCAPDNYS